MEKTKLVAVNEHGRRIGESHPRAKLTDHEVDLIRQLAEPELDEEGNVVRPRLTYREIAEKFELNVRSAKRIVGCYQRAQVPARHKRVLVKREETTTE